MYLVQNLKILEFASDKGQMTLTSKWEYSNPARELSHFSLTLALGCLSTLNMLQDGFGWDHSSLAAAKVTGAWYSFSKAASPTKANESALHRNISPSSLVVWWTATSLESQGQR